LEDTGTLVYFWQHDVTLHKPGSVRGDVGRLLMHQRRFPLAHRRGNSVNMFLLLVEFYLPFSL